MVNGESEAMMGNPEKVKPADWATVKRIVENEPKEGVDDHKPLGGRNEDYGPDAETPKCAQLPSGGPNRGLRAGSRNPRSALYYYRDE